MQNIIRALFTAFVAVVSFSPLNYAMGYDFHSFATSPIDHTTEIPFTITPDPVSKASTGKDPYVWWIRSETLDPENYDPDPSVHNGLKVYVIESIGFDFETRIAGAHTRWFLRKCGDRFRLLGVLVNSGELTSVFSNVDASQNYKTRFISNVDAASYTKDFPGANAWAHTERNAALFLLQLKMDSAAGHLDFSCPEGTDGIQVAVPQID